MKFKLLFGLLMMFGVFAGLNAQSYLPADQAVANLEAAIADFHNGTADVPTPSSSTTLDVVNSKQSSLVSSLYPAFLNMLIEEISEDKDVSKGFDRLMTQLSAEATGIKRQTILTHVSDYALELITN